MIEVPVDPPAHQQRPKPYHAFRLVLGLLVVGAAMAFVVAFRYKKAIGKDDFVGAGISGAAAWLLFLWCWVVLGDLVALLRQKMRYLDFLGACRLASLEKWRYKTVILCFLGGIFLGHRFWS